jgi:hypothetical protein
VLDYSVLHEVWGSYGRRVVGRAIRHRRTSYARGAQVTSEAHRLRPDSVGTNRSNNGRRGERSKKGLKTPPQAGDILIANFKIM